MRLKARKCNDMKIDEERYLEGTIFGTKLGKAERKQQKANNKITCAEERAMRGQ